MPNTGSGKLEGARGDVVVYFAGSRWEGPPGHDRHMAQALSELAPVLFVEPPVSVLARLRRQAATGPATADPLLRVLGPRLAHLTTPVPPGQSRPVLHRLVAPAVRRSARAALDRLFGPGSQPVAAMLTSRVEDLGAVLPARRTIYYATDDLVAGAAMLGLPRERLLRDEGRTLRRVDAVAAVSPALRDRYVEAGFPAELLPNGCLPDAYADVDRAPLPEDLDLPPGPVAGLLGHINDRIDLARLEAVADSGCTLLIVGPVARGYQPDRFMALTARSNVRWVGPRPHAQMPSYLRVIDVGLTPYLDNEFNRGSFPLKTLEYLAAGRGVVATALPATRWLDTDLIAMAGQPDEFAAKVSAELARPRTDALVAARRAFAKEHSWARRARRLAELLGVGPAAQSPATESPAAEAPLQAG